MKIYEIGTGYTPIPAQMGAATEIVVEELTKAFLKKGVPVEIIDIAAENRPANNLPIREVKVPKRFAGTDVQLGLMHKLKRVVYSIALAKQLKKILAASEERVILHFHNQYNLFFFLKLSSKKLREMCTIVYTNHSHVWHGEWENITHVIQKRYFQEVYGMKRADYVFVLNQKTADHIINQIGLPAERITLIDNGVNTDIYHKMDEAGRIAVLEKQGFSGKRVFVQIGSVCERKNQLESVRLLLPILKEDKNTVFCYAGGVISEEYSNAIDQFAVQNGVQEQVRYLGELMPGEELNGIYNMAEAMVFPSRAEGFSLVILEAMAAGLPVFVSRELQFKLADDCLRFADETEFQNILRAQVLDKKNREHHSIKARQAIESAYGWEKIAQDYLCGWQD